MKRYESWGRFPHAAQRGHALVSSDDVSWMHRDTSVLPFGRGRSQGDVCLNSSGVVLDTGRLDAFLSFDAATGLLSCQGSVTLGEILDVITRKGWFLPAVPGTKEVTIGGAIANDVHGKNQHVSGTFGHHVVSFTLLRSTGEKIVCSSLENLELFRATIGGLGLTGLILSATIRCKKIASLGLRVEKLRFADAKEGIALLQESKKTHEHCVLWMDGFSPTNRGYVTRATECDTSAPMRPQTSSPTITVPFAAPGWLLNGVSMRSYNAIHLHRSSGISYERYERFFFPLDSVGKWNLLYGKRGFLQYQCVLPAESSLHVLAHIRASCHRPFLITGKSFDARSPAGLLSFVRQGESFAFDFPYTGTALLSFLDELDLMVMRAGGAVYPAKDARMSNSAFQCYYPKWKEFSAFVDPRFSSDFWRRVTSPS